MGGDKRLATLNQLQWYRARPNRRIGSTLAMKLLRPVIFAMLALVAGVFLILGSQHDESKAPPGFTTVEYWEKWVDPEAKQMQIIVDDFNRTVGRDKKIFVHYMSMTDIDQKTLISIAAGVPPDITGSWDTQIAQFAAIGAVERLDDLAAAHGITKDYYLPVYWNGCTYGGHLYALVSTPGAVALLYNKQIFKECAVKLRAAGLDPDRAPRTLDEFDRYAAVFDVKDKNGRLQRAGYLPLQSWYIPELGFWFGADIFDAEHHRMRLDSPEMLRAYQWILSYSNRIGGQTLLNFQNAMGNNFDSPQNPFIVGKLVMEQQGPWMANYIAHLKPSMSQLLVPTSEEWKLKDRTDNYAWGVAPFPSAVPGLENVSYNTFDALMIPAGAKHKNEAFEFIAYVNRQDVAEKLCSLHSKNCQLRHVSENFIKHHPNPYIAIYQELASSPNARCVPRCPIWLEVFKELTDSAQAVTLGEDPAVALTLAQGRMQQRYDRFLTLETRREQLGIN
jgi:multiple sugar transport system substrate-binding protein